MAFKMRNGSNPTTQLAQWFGRKCRNHNPLSELKVGVHKFGQVAEGGVRRQQKQGVFTLEHSPNTIVYSNGQFTYMIEITEVSPDVMVEELEDALIKVPA